MIINFKMKIKFLFFWMFLIVSLTMVVFSYC